MNRAKWSVWYDGAIYLETNDRTKAEQAADSGMRNRRSVWLCRTGSFVNR